MIGYMILIFLAGALIGMIIMCFLAFGPKIFGHRKVKNIPVKEK